MVKERSSEIRIAKLVMKTTENIKQLRVSSASESCVSAPSYPEFLH